MEHLVLLSVQCERLCHTNLHRYQLPLVTASLLPCRPLISRALSPDVACKMLLLPMLRWLPCEGEGLCCTVDCALCDWAPIALQLFSCFYRCCHAAAAGEMLSRRRCGRPSRTTRPSPRCDRKCLDSHQDTGPLSVVPSAFGTVTVRISCLFRSLDPADAAALPAMAAPFTRHCNSAPASITSPPFLVPLPSPRSAQARGRCHLISRAAQGDAPSCHSRDDPLRRLHPNVRSAHRALPRAALLRGTPAVRHGCAGGSPSAEDRIGAAWRFRATSSRSIEMLFGIFSCGLRFAAYSALSRLNYSLV